MTSEGSGFAQPSIPKFDGHYDHWAMLMENFLRSKEYWDLVEMGISKRTEDKESGEKQKKVIDKELEEERKAIDGLKLKDLKVKNYLFQAIDMPIMETILDKDSSKSIWDSMKQKYQGTTKVKRAQLQELRREFELLQMLEGEKVDEYFAQTLTIANKMKIHGEKIGQVMIVEKILRTMTQRFNYVVCSIEESNDLDKMTIDEL
ncbi:uncharacterized protein LOC141719795 [Apium graveolens]|uniref:uncharacterized protein LOC141719795 n=1 Tax=Apium graveolens TaxID=4045 RepID=UPI003D7B103B